MRDARFSAVMLYGIGAVALVAGSLVVTAGLRHSPGDAAAAQAFRSDASCRADLAQPTARGACHVVAATIDEASEFEVGSVRSRTKEYVVRLRLANGRRVIDHLSGPAGAAFVDKVGPGTAGQALFFHAVLVRVAADGVTAETMSAPDVRASSDSVLPWVGMRSSCSA